MSKFFRIADRAVRLGPGHRTPRHRLHGAACLQVLDGRLRVRLGKHTLEVDAGQMLALEKDVPFDIESEMETAYLTTPVSLE